jgi:hypothetical protein
MMEKLFFIRQNPKMRKEKTLAKIGKLETILTTDKWLNTPKMK